MLVGPCALAGLPLRCPLACRAAAPCAAPSLRWSAAPRPSASMLPAAPCPSTMFCGLLPAPPPAGHSPVLSHPSLRWRLACSLAQTAGGAGCGQPPAHKACRKTILRVCSWPLDHLYCRFVFRGLYSFSGITRIRLARLAQPAAFFRLLQVACVRII